MRSRFYFSQQIFSFPHYEHVDLGGIVTFWLDFTDLGPVLCVPTGTHQPNSDSGERATAFKREPSVEQPDQRCLERHAGLITSEQKSC